MLPKPIYENLPYVYIVISLGLMAGHSSWVVLGFAWLMYTAGAITWVLRSDARRVNPRRPKVKKNFFMHDDLYESMPFFYIGGGILISRFSNHFVFSAFGVLLLILGATVLAIRISKRKISWIDDWRRYRGSAVVAKKQHRQKSTSIICDQCLIKESCRSSGLCDKSNILVMSWLLAEHDQSELGKLRWEIDEMEFSPVSEERLLRVLLKSKPFAPQCLVMTNRRKMKLVAVP